MPGEATLVENEIYTDKVRIADRISIHTRNSVYTFLVVDPVKSYGFVVGGVIGPHPAEAYLDSISTLKVGSKVRLLVLTNKFCRFIKTSTIITVCRLPPNDDDEF